jgi:tetratricopeptide (TPR) repeat protein
MIYVNDSKFNTVYNFKEEYRPKLFRRLRTFKWISPIHETVRLEPVVFDSDIKILHLPEASHSKRDFDTFINAVQKGVRLENYVVIMFCKELFISGTDNDFLHAADIFENVLAKEDRNSECRNNIACVLARIYRLKNDYNNFFKVCLKNIAESPCAEICLELGDYFYSLEDYEEAVLWYINAASETESIISIHSSGDTPLYRLAKCYTKLAQLAKNNGNEELYNIYSGNGVEYREQAEAWIQQNNQ